MGADHGKFQHSKHVRGLCFRGWQSVCQGVLIQFDAVENIGIHKHEVDTTESLCRAMQCTGGRLNFISYGRPFMELT